MATLAHIHLERLCNHWQFGLESQIGNLCQSFANGLQLHIIRRPFHHERLDMTQKLLQARLAADELSTPSSATRVLDHVVTHAYISLILADMLRKLEDGDLRDAYIRVAKHQQHWADQTIKEQLKEATDAQW